MFRASGWFDIFQNMLMNFPLEFGNGFVRLEIQGILLVRWFYAKVSIQYDAGAL